MSTQSKISKILLAAALGAGSTAYATEQNGNVSLPNAVSTSGSSATQIIQQTPPIIKTGLFTNTVSTSTIFTREEMEYSLTEGAGTKVLPTPDGTLSLDLGANFSNTSPALRATPSTNTYLETSVCETNIFLGTRCESTYKKIDSKPSVSPISQLMAPYSLKIE